MRIDYVDANGDDIEEITLSDDANSDDSLDNLTVDTFSPSGPQLYNLNNNGQLDEDGNGTFEVGATLQIPKNLDLGNMGNYSGTVRIEVEDDYP